MSNRHRSATVESQDRPSQKALRAFDQFIVEVAEERASRATVTPSWLLGAHMSTSTASWAGLLRAVAGMSATAIGVRLALPIAGALFGPVGAVVGGLGAAAWAAFSAKDALDRLKQEANQEEARQIAAGIRRAQGIFDELQGYRQEDPDEVDTQLRQLFDDLVQDRLIL